MKININILQGEWTSYEISAVIVIIYTCAYECERLDNQQKQNKKLNVQRKQNLSFWNIQILLIIFASMSHEVAEMKVQICIWY